MASVLEIKNTFVFEPEYCEVVAPKLTRANTEPIRVHLRSMLLEAEDFQGNFKSHSVPTINISLLPGPMPIHSEDQEEGSDPEDQHLQTEDEEEEEGQQEDQQQQQQPQHYHAEEEEDEADHDEGQQPQEREGEEQEEEDKKQQKAEEQEGVGRTSICSTPTRTPFHDAFLSACSCSEGGLPLQSPFFFVGPMFFPSNNNNNEDRQPAEDDQHMEHENEHHEEEEDHYENAEEGEAKDNYHYHQNEEEEEEEEEAQQSPPPQPAREYYYQNEEEEEEAVGSPPQPALGRLKTFDAMEDMPIFPQHFPRLPIHSIRSESDSDDNDNNNNNNIATADNNSNDHLHQPLPQLTSEHRLRTYDPMEDNDVDDNNNNSNSSGCNSSFFNSSGVHHQSSSASVETPAAPAVRVLKTTLMLRNIPRCFHRDMLVDLLEREGFGDGFDFLYFPYKFEVGSPEGYAFVNAVSEEVAAQLAKHFTNFTDWGVPGNRKCTIGWSKAAMGLDANIHRYRNSPVMHPNVPEHWKPLRRSNGVTIPFEPPTKSIKPPRKGTKLVRFESS